MKRSYYSSTIDEFLKQSDDNILSELVRHNPFDLNDLQRNAWIEEIDILKRQLNGLSPGRILFEYTIPRMGKRVDVVVLYGGIVFLLEFKVGATEYYKYMYDQVMDYALDLKNFQKACEHLPIVPIAIPTEAYYKKNVYDFYPDKVCKPISANKTSIQEVILDVSKIFKYPDFDYNVWEDAPYMPTPTIIEAARAFI